MTDTLVRDGENTCIVKSVPCSDGYQFIFIGDSLTVGTGSVGANQGLTGKFERIEFYTTRFLTGEVAYSVLNKGTGGNSISQIEARLQADALDNSPVYPVIQGGVNDIIGGTSEATFLAKWRSILSMCRNEGKVPIVVLLPPWTAATEAQAITRDAWNVSLSGVLDDEYPEAIKVDEKPYSGLFRAGGPDGNLWDLVASYTIDGVHRTNAGYSQMARAIYDAI